MAEEKIGPITPAIEIRKEITDREEWVKAGKPVEGQSFRRVFFILSGLLFLSFVWAVWNEFVTRRPWTQYQRQFFQLEKEMTQEALQRDQERFETEDAERFSALGTELKEADQNLESPEFQKTRRELRKTEIVLDEMTQEYQFAKSEADAAYYLYKKALHEEKDASKAKKKLEKFEAKMASMIPEIEEFSQKRDEYKEEVNEKKKRVREIRKEMAQMTMGMERLKQKLKSMRFKTAEIEQIVIQDFDRNFFNQPVMRVDRCMSCHLGIDREGFEEAPQPFRTHPKREILFANHPIEQFGCTPCHQGQGRALTVEDAHGHVPFWEHPMLLGEFIESSCIQCHIREKEIPLALTVSSGKNLFRELGCHGCHVTEGFENLAPVGPPLMNLGSKIKADWIVWWILNPKDYLPETKMPRFNLSVEEAKAIAAYLLSFPENETRSNIQHPARHERGRMVSSIQLTNGKELFDSSGCITCHNLEGHQSAGAVTIEKIGPDLSKLWMKVNPDWLYSWLKNPKEFHPDTRMPRFHFTDGEAKVLTTYLLSKGGSIKERDEDLSFLENDSMKVRGKKLIQTLGCFGCHVTPEMEGMPKMPKVGVELTEFGSKKTHELDFGDTKFSHTWNDWTFNKLKDPRIYETERIQLKMPDFSFSDEEAKSLVIFLKSLTGEEIPHDFLVTAELHTPHSEFSTLKGPFGKINQEFNCLVCHRINGEGGEIGPDLSYEGTKVKKDWLVNFLKTPYKIRPNEKARMPKFNLTNREVKTIVDYMNMILVNDEVTALGGVVREREIDEATLREGERLYQEVYGCVSCHRIGNTGGVIGPDLTHVGSRLQGEWTYSYLKDPQALQGKVRMPHFNLSDRHAKVLSEYLMAQN